MITENTVFIIGAGASEPYGFPIGEKLAHFIGYDLLPLYKELILKDVAGDTPSLIYEIQAFTEDFARASNYSIDVFLSRNPKYSNVGRKAIIFSILLKEKESKLKNNTGSISGDWYKYLLKVMMEGLDRPDDYNKFLSNRVCFITFNYDRSLEEYLYRSLRHSFLQAEETEIIKLLKSIPIYHIYGKVAPLPWESYMNSFEYGANFLYKHLNEFKNNIRVIGDRVEEQIPEIDTIRTKISGCSKLIFLGFGYASENMKILGLPGTININQKRNLSMRMRHFHKTFSVDFPRPQMVLVC